MGQTNTTREWRKTTIANLIEELLSVVLDMFLKDKKSKCTFPEIL